jgi:hypothetical protein
MMSRAVNPFRARRPAAVTEGWSIAISWIMACSELALVRFAVVTMTEYSRGSSPPAAHRHHGAPESSDDVNRGRSATLKGFPQTAGR